MLVWRDGKPMSLATGSEFVDIHITSYTRILICMPCSTETRSSLKDTELIESQDLSQSTAHCDARLPGTDNEDRIVCVAGSIVEADMTDAVDSSRHLGCRCRRLDSMYCL